MLCRLNKASCVVVGTFNIYVVQPSLLKAIGVLPKEDSLVRMEANFTQPGFRYTSKDLNATWLVRPDRVIVETTDPLKDCGADVASVLDALRWTPVTAVGSNAEYTSDGLNGSELAGIFASFGRKWTAEGHEVEQTTFHVSIKRGERTFNLQAAQVGSNFEIACNTHVEVKDKDVVGASEFCQRTAANFMEQRREARELIKDVFSIEVSDEPDSHQRIRDQERANRESA